MFHMLKYINKSLHIQHKINKNFNFTKNTVIKRKWVHLYKPIPKRHIQLTSNLHYTELKNKK